MMDCHASGRTTRRHMLGAAVPSASIRGFRIYAFRSVDELVAQVTEPTILVALNAEKVANADEDVRRIANENVGYPDGIGVVLALRQRGLRAARIPGADLWLSLARMYAGRRHFYLVGSTPAVVRETVTRLAVAFPGISIVGFRDGYFGSADIDQLETDILATKPDVVLVSMGSPRQELLMEQLIRVWPALYMGLGGSFDVFVGHRRRAPSWMQRANLEWFFRFVENPRRLSRLPAYIRFAWLLARNRL